MSPQRKLVTSEFGKNLIVDIGKSKKADQEEDTSRSRRRHAVLGADFNLSTLGLTQSEVLLKKIKDTMALLHKDNKVPVPVKSEFKLDVRSDERISAS